MSSFTYIENNNEFEIVINRECLDALDAVEFIDTINNIPDNAKIVTINIAQTTFLNSAGLAMITKANIILSRRNIKLVLSNASDDIKRLFEITRLNTIIKIL